MERIVYMRTSGGAPPNFLRVVIDATGDVVAERHRQFPPPASVTTRRGTCGSEAVARLVAVLDSLDHAALHGPPVDSPNEWFELTTQGTTRTFSIVSLFADPVLTQIRSCLAGILDAIGGEP